MRPLAVLPLLVLATAGWSQNWNGTGTTLSSLAPLKAAFDDYTLSVEWHPEFCAHMAEVGRSFGECAPGSAEASDGLTLHGLWPDQSGNQDFGYCGVDGGLDHPGQFCDLPDTGLSPSALRQLGLAMPGAGQPGPNGCLERHEWYKHGTCSGLAAPAYFSLAGSLYSQVAGGALGTFLAQNAGSTVSASDLLAAARQDWGDAGAGAMSLSCGRVSGGAALSEVRFTLSPSLGPGSALAGSFLPAAGPGNCPVSFQLIAPAR